MKDLPGSNSQFKQNHSNFALKTFLGVLSAEKNMGPPGGPPRVFFADTPQARY
jgi:hypothetical protein